LVGTSFQLEHLHQRVEGKAHDEADADDLAALHRGRIAVVEVRIDGRIPRFLRRTRDQNLCARGAFRILEDAVLVLYQSTAERDHHQDPEQSAEYRDHGHPPDLEFEPEDQDRRHCHADTERDGLARRPRRLDDVVLEYRRVACSELGQYSKQRDRDDRHRYGSRHRQTDLQDQIER
jgi:hypothetical protein